MIKVYSLPNCVQCQQTKRLLDSSDVKYTEIDLSKDFEAVAHVAALGYKQAPVVETAKSHWSGFKYEKIKTLIADYERGLI